MRRMILAALTALLWGGFASTPSGADTSRFSKIVGVDAGVGLPNGAVVRVYDCEQTGSTRWCKVALEEVRGLRGYVNSTYLQEM
jgi:hypothetical protein